MKTPARRKVALLMQVNKEYDRQIIAGISKFANDNGHWSVYLEDERHAKIPDRGQWRGNGFIADLDDEAIARAVSRLKIPVVGIGGFSEASMVPHKVPYIASDCDAIGKLGAEHLMDCQLRHFAYCGIPSNRFNSWSRFREKAFVARLAESGFRCSVFRGYQTSARKWEALQKGLVKWLSRLDTPLGVMACEDPRARHIVEACHRLGRRIPDDVAVLGVDNDEMMCALCNPPLSSVAQGAYRIGYQAANLLDQMMSSRRSVRKWTVVGPNGVVARQSTNVLDLSHEDVGEALRFIRASVSDAIRVSDVLKKVGVSRSTLDRKFQKSVGHNVNDEIQRVRLNKAKYLLTGTALSSRVIAQQAGYRTPQYFCSAFRRSTGLTPGDFRRRE